jgi:outer membrane lipoprotein SlyB
MNSRLCRYAVAIAIAAAPMGAFALGNNEKGCLVGGAVGGVAGQAIKGDGKSTLLGAAAGCGVGYLVNKERVKKNNEVADLKKRNAKLSRKVNRDEPARYSRQDPNYTQPPIR